MGKGRIFSEEEIPEYCQTVFVEDHHGRVKQLILPKALDLDRPKRARTWFTTAQLEVLEIEYRKNPYISGDERKALAKRLKLSETQVKVWYQNRRTKTKKEKKQVCPSVSDSPPFDSRSSETNDFWSMAMGSTPTAGTPSFTHFWPPIPHHQNLLMSSWLLYNQQTIASMSQQKGCLNQDKGSLDPGHFSPEAAEQPGHDCQNDSLDLESPATKVNDEDDEQEIDIN